jgi:hypothetical protein
VDSNWPMRLESSEQGKHSMQQTKVMLFSNVKPFSSLLESVGPSQSAVLK